MIQHIQRNHHDLGVDELGYDDDAEEVEEEAGNQ
jgi:hypothetical protein